MRSSQAFSAGKSSSEISHQPAAAIQPQCAMSAERQRRVISGLSIIDVCLWLGAGARIWRGGGAGISDHHHHRPVSREERTRETGPREREREREHDVPAIVHFSPVRYAKWLSDRCLSSTPYSLFVSLVYRPTPYSILSGAYLVK